MKKIFFALVLFTAVLAGAVSEEIKKSILVDNMNHIEWSYKDSSSVVEIKFITDARSLLDENLAQESVDEELPSIINELGYSESSLGSVKRDDDPSGAYSAIVFSYNLQ